MAHASAAHTRVLLSLPQVSYHLGSAASDRAGILGLDPVGRPCTESLTFSN